MNSYPKHVERPVHILDGIWDFTFLGEDTDLDSLDVSQLCFDALMPVPSAFDVYPRYAGRRGTAVYRTRATITPGTRSRLRFHGLGMWARILVDGQAIAEHALPYTGFWVDVPPTQHDERELVVVIDNRFDVERVPLQEQYFDFYAYGGIFRSVEWHEVPECCIERVHVTTVDWAAGTVEAKVVLHGSDVDSMDFRASIDGREEQHFPGVPVHDSIANLDLSVSNPAPWHPDSPALHTLHVRTADDDIIERFGLRSVEATAGKIAVNGAEVKLCGFNLHQFHPQYGPALPDQQLVQDLQLLKDLGCNFVRGAHYPQDQRFLDLCDELGFLVMEESLGWQPKPAHFQNAAFCSAQELQTRMMVQTSFNHPSVIMWGFLNEGESHKEESRVLYERLVSCIRDEDPGRLVSYASNHPSDDINFDLVDVICINAYPGWYASDLERVAPHDEIMPYMESVLEDISRRGFGDKPFVLSEIGAGAIYGWRDPLHAHWTEEYQAKYMDIVCGQVLPDPRVSGVTIWHFCDYRTSATAWALGRPRGYNNKGIVDEYRRPKLAYEVVKRNFMAVSGRGGRSQ